MLLGFTKSEIEIDGKKMAYYEKGSGETTCLFSCGWGAPFPFADMSDLAAALSKTTRCVVFDRFGYGWSDDYIGSRTFGAVTSEMKQLLDALGVTGNIVYVGHSLGTFQGLDFAKTYPEMLKAMVLIDGPYAFTAFERLILKWNWVIAFCMLVFKKFGIVKRIRHEKIEKVMFGNRVLPDDLKKEAVAVVRKRLYNKTLRNELRDSLRDLKLLFTGVERARNIPITAFCRNFSLKMHQRLQNHLPDTRLINMGKTSHMIHRDFPNEIIEQIKACAK